MSYTAALQGNRDNIDSMAQGSQKVLGQVLKLIDLYDLYGSVAYPKVNSMLQRRQAVPIFLCGNTCNVQLKVSA